MNPTEQVVIDGLSKLICKHLSNAAHQQYNPDFSPDSMDAKIADGQRKARELRRLREEFEDTITGIIAPF